MPSHNSPDGATVRFEAGARSEFTAGSQSYAPEMNERAKSIREIPARYRGLEILADKASPGDIQFACALQILHYLFADEHIFLLHSKLLYFAFSFFLCNKADSLTFNNIK